ncbi:MAG: hypothetical protein ACR2PT_07980 [Endozoicomonas sp.]
MTDILVRARASEGTKFAKPDQIIAVQITSKDEASHESVPYWDGYIVKTLGDEPGCRLARRYLPVESFVGIAKSSKLSSWLHVRFSNESSVEPDPAIPCIHEQDTPVVTKVILVDLGKKDNVKPMSYSLKDFIYEDYLASEAVNLSPGHNALPLLDLSSAERFSDITINEAPIFKNWRKKTNQRNEGNNQGQNNPGQKRQAGGDAGARAEPEPEAGDNEGGDNDGDDDNNGGGDRGNQNANIERQNETGPVHAQYPARQYIATKLKEIIFAMLARGRVIARGFYYGAIVVYMPGYVFVNTHIYKQFSNSHFSHLSDPTQRLLYHVIAIQLDLAKMVAVGTSPEIYIRSIEHSSSEKRERENEETAGLSFYLVKVLWAVTSPYWYSGRFLVCGRLSDKACLELLKEERERVEKEELERMKVR